MAGEGTRGKRKAKDMQTHLLLAGTGPVPGVGGIDRGGQDSELPSGLAPACPGPLWAGRRAWL